MLAALETSLVEYESRVPRTGDRSRGRSAHLSPRLDQPGSAQKTAAESLVRLQLAIRSVVQPPPSNGVSSEARGPERPHAQLEKGRVGEEVESSSSTKIPGSEGTPAREGLSTHTREGGAIAGGANTQTGRNLVGEQAFLAFGAVR